MKPKLRFIALHQVWICLYMLLGFCLCTSKFLQPPQNPSYGFLLQDSLKTIFLRALDVVFFTHSLKSRDEMMPRSELPSLLFYHCPASLADSPLTHWQYTHYPLWQAGIQLCLQKLICPVDSASRIRISQCNPNNHTANFENIHTSSR